MPCSIFDPNFRPDFHALVNGQVAESWPTVHCLLWSNRMASKNDEMDSRSGECANTCGSRILGFVDLDAVYAVAEFRRRLGMSDAALRAARRRGLKVLRSGKRAYVCGRDFLDFLREESAGQ